MRTVGLAERGGATRDSRSVILGGGAIGLLCAQVMKAGGYAPPRIAETNSLRRVMLEELGLGETYDPRDGGPEDGTVDLVIDAVGMGVTRAAASVMVRPAASLFMSASRTMNRASIHGGLRFRKLRFLVSIAIAMTILPRQSRFDQWQGRR